MSHSQGTQDGTKMGAPMPDPENERPRWLDALPLIYLLSGLAWILGSDLIVGWLYREDLRALVYASTLKGALFIILTATLLYVLLAMRRGDYAPGPRALDPIELRKPLLAFGLVGLGIATIGYVVYLLEADGIRDRVGMQLGSSAELAAAEMELWHDGRVRSMRQVGDSPFTARAVADWQASRSALLESLLRDRLEAIRDSQGYSSVAAVQADGATILEVGRPIEMTATLGESIRDAAAGGGVISSWHAVDDGDGSRRPVVDLAVPISNPTDAVPRVVAIIVARADLRWPLGATVPEAEHHGGMVALARVADDQVEFLEPAPPGAAARYVQVPRAHADLFAVKGVLGEPGAYAARDMEEREVQAVANAVKGTPWFTIASVDEAVVEQQVRRMMLLILGMTTLGFVATGALVLPWWRSVRAGAAAMVARAESRTEEMAARLGWVTRHANDVILLIDPDGRILDANDRAEQVYGYTRDELLAMTVFRLRPEGADSLAMARAQFEIVKSDGSLLFETTHVRKDGTPVTVEVSSRKVAIGNRAYVQSIVRDISERRRSEQRLRDSEAQYRLLFRSNPHPMWVYDVETLRFLAVNDAAVEHYGYSEPEFLGMTIAEIRPEADRPRLDADVVEHADDVLQRSGNWRHRRKNGTLIDVEITSHRIDFGGRRARLVLAHDITGRLQAERALRASEERYRNLFENASDGVIVIGSGREVLAANAEYQLMLGYSPEELLGADLAVLLDEREHQRLATAAAGLSRGELIGPANWVHRRKDGSRFTGEVRIRTLPGGELLATVRDLTEIIAARRQIERQRDLYDLLSQCNEAIVRASDRPVLLHSVARLAVERGHFLFAWIGEVTERGEVVPAALHGEDHGYVAGLRISVDPSQPEGAGPTSRAIREGKPVIVNDFLNDAATAPWREAARRRGIGASAAYPLFTGGKPTAALMLYAGEPGFFDAEIAATLGEMAADVSFALDSMRTRRELEDQRLLLQSLINASDALVFAFDLEGRAILMNEACARAMGGTRAALLGQRRESTMPRATALLHESNDRRVVETGEHLALEERNVEPGGERVYLSVKYPLRDVDGRIYAVGGIATDITELRHAQQELAAANLLLEEKVAERTREATEARERAEAADRAKTIFLSSMSHELRSPLHSIIGFTSVLLEGLEGELTPVQQQHLQVVSEASHHLLAIINDLLDMSKIEAGAISLEFKPLPVGRSLERVMQRFSLQAQQKGLELRLEAPETEIWVESDERRIEQIVSNLVSNAVKYTPAGSVVVTCGVHVNQLRIDVRDTGPGIAAGDQARLFRRFAQLKPAHGGLTDGTGLGLAIAAGLAEALGGEVVLESEVGVGSVFTLLLPIAPAKEDQ